MSGNKSGEKPLNYRITALVVLLGLYASLCGCSFQTNDSSDSLPSEQSSEFVSSSVQSKSSTAFSSSSFSSESSSFYSSSTSESSSEYSVSSSSAFSSEYSSSSSSAAASSSRTPNSSSSSSAPPPNVVIPDFEVPTSPGTAIITDRTKNAVVIYYSNATKGYVSVKYTGSSKRVKFRYVCGDKTYNFDIPVNGTVVYLPLSCGSGQYSFYVFENISGNTYSTLLSENVSIKVKDNVTPYTYPNQFVSYKKSSECGKKAAELCAGKTGTIDKISAVFLYISDNITYDYNLASTVKSGYIPDPDKTLKSKKGICFDYASLMSAMLRSQGIPTRLVIGYASPDIYHAWNEVYTEQTGWITPELLMSSRGYNLADATFYASASDKKTIADYIMNSSNYNAVYYY